MVPSKVRNGSMLQDTSEIGKITVRKVSVFSFSKMEISMKVCGEVTNAMARVLTGETKMAS